jgi:hypothetical protein
VISSNPRWLRTAPTAYPSVEAKSDPSAHTIDLPAAFAFIEFRRELDAEDAYYDM